MREIDWEKPLSKEDEDWVEQYANRAMRRQVKLNRDRFGDVEEAVSNEEGTDVSPEEDDYDSMTLDQLKALAKARKKEYPEFDTSGIGNKAELIERLREWDAENPAQ